jgi:Probable Zinc-ribbon domain
MPNKNKDQSLAITHPELALQAVGWDPATLSAGSHKKVKWQCPLKPNHIYPARVSHRSKGSGCPFCSGHQVLNGDNDLATTHPELALQAVDWDPATLSAGSGKKVNWQCPLKLNHIYPATVASRSNGRGCPFCSGQRVLAGDNDLATTHPELALQAVGWDPATLSAGSNKKVKWQCPLKPNHRYSAVVYNRVKGSGCPFCSGHQVLAGDNDLATTHPELVLQAVGWDPATFSSGSNKKVKWQCPLKPNHIYTATVASRSNGRGCPFCSGHQVLAGDNDLATTHPELALQAVGWDSATLTSGSHKKVKWQCPLKPNHIYPATVNSRSKGSGCPFCSGHQVLNGDNDLATTHPELALQAVGWDPATLSAGSGKKVNWQCPLKLNHIYPATVASRSNGRGCPFCSGNQILAGDNDLATTHPELALQAVGWDPAILSAGSDKKVNWQCPLKPNHIYPATVASRSKGSGCPFCSGHQVLAGDNDLATTHPELALQAVGWDPATLSAGSNKKVKWQCPLKPNHIYTATVANRSNGTGCPSCASSGFDPYKDGYLYFIRHLDFDMLQIGITNAPEERLKNHKSKGWDILEVRGPMDGHLTKEWETAILKMLKGRGADLANNTIAGNFDGYTEAWSRSKFDAKSIFELMRLTEEFEVKG